MTKAFEFNYKNFILYGIIFEIMLNLNKPFAAKFLQRIGGSDLHISLLNSLPGFIMFFIVLPGSIYVDRIHDRKKITCLLIVITRVFVLFMALVPFLPIVYQPMAFVLVVALMSGPNSIYMNSYQGVLGDMFNPKERAKAIGDRNRFAIFASLIVAFVAGQVLTKLPNTEAERILIYQILFILSFIMSIVELKVFNRFKLKEHVVVKRESMKIIFSRLIKNKEFKIFVGCSLLYHFGWQMAWPLFSIYTIKVLGANEAWLAIIKISQSIVMFFAYKFWIKKIDRHGNPLVTSICTLGMAITPLLYVVSKNLYVLTATCIISGIFTAGTVSVLLGDLLEVVPEKNRLIYLGVYNTFINLSLGVSPLVGHYFLDQRGIVYALVAASVFRLFGSGAFFLRSKHLKRVNSTG